MADKGIKVTVEDLETGDTASRIVPLNDYFVLGTGECHISHIAAHKNGTHQITIKGCKPEPAEPDEASDG